MATIEFEQLVNQYIDAAIRRSPDLPRLEQKLAIMYPNRVSEFLSICRVTDLLIAIEDNEHTSEAIEKRIERNLFR